MRTRSEPSDEAIAAGLTGVLFVGLAVAVASARTSHLDAALRRAQPHPKRGRLYRGAKQVKRIAKPNAQLAVAAATSFALWRWRVPGGLAVVGAVLGVVLSDKGCKAIVRRRRPSGYHGKESHESFPSGHTATAAALTLTLARILENASIVPAPTGTLAATCLTLLVGETRLMLDEHWPTDVLAGLMLGSASACGALAWTTRDRSQDSRRPNSS